MISVCCCIFNAKWDVQTLIEACEYHNDPAEFEIVVTLDDRVEDGSLELLRDLQTRYDNLKVVVHTDEDTIEYMSAALDYYHRRQFFNEEIRVGMRDALERYKKGELLNKSKAFLWQSSGILYNKAVEASSGDVILVTPGDFLYLFGLGNLERFVRKHAIGDIFYASPPAIWARVNNMDPEWLRRHINEVHNDAQKARPGFRWDSRETFRDYLRYPPQLSDFNLPDFRNNRMINFTDPDFLDKSRQFCIESMTQGGVQCNPKFHGCHVMTRKTFEMIGGFTEEWIHRAFPDDKMTYLGSRIGGHTELPPQFAFAWLGNGELLPGHGPGYEDAWKVELPKVDPLWDKHPIPPRVHKVYLHDKIVKEKHMNDLVRKSFGTNTPPIRIGTCKRIDS